MTQFSILDCTLRDGGYYTDWEFSPDLVSLYFKAVASLPIEFVEIGYRSPVKSGYAGRFFHMARGTIQDCRAQLRPDQKVAIMLNFKDATLDNIDGLISDLSGVVDIVRFACPPDRLEDCIRLAERVRANGMQAAINVMYLTRYCNDPSYLVPLAGAGDIVNFVGLVDSYGGVTPHDTRKIYEWAAANLPQRLGFHGHDNLCLAFANSLAALESGATILESTICGMGRGAGNLRTELIAIHREKLFPTRAPMGPLSRALERFEAMQKEYGWGTNLAYMISGASGLPQADVMDWLGTKRYQMDAIVAALQSSAELALDTREFDGLSASDFARSHMGRPVIVTGGGGSVLKAQDAILELGRSSGAVLIHSSLRNAQAFAGHDLPQIFCLSGQELDRLSQHQRELFHQPNSIVVSTQPPRFHGVVPDVSSVYQVKEGGKAGADKLGPVADEPPIELALSAAQALDAKVLYLAGFDGYPSADLAQQRIASDTQAAINSARAPGNTWNDRLYSITPTLYDIPARSVWAIIQPGS